MENNIKERVIKNPYNEVYGILVALGNDFINKIPKEILNNITRNLTFKIENDKKVYEVPKYDLKISLNIQGVSREALSVIYYLYYNYWCTLDKEKNYLYNLIRNNEKKIQKLEIKKYENIDIFPNKDGEEENMPIIINQKKWYKEIFNKLLDIFKKNN